MKLAEWSSHCSESWEYGPFEHWGYLAILCYLKFLWISIALDYQRKENRVQGFRGLFWKSMKLDERAIYGYFGVHKENQARSRFKWMIETILNIIEYNKREITTLLLGKKYQRAKGEKYITNMHRHC